MISDITRYAEFTDEQVFHGVCLLFPFMREALEKLSILIVVKGWTDDQTMAELEKYNTEFDEELTPDEKLFIYQLMQRAVRHPVSLLLKCQSHAASN